MTSQWTVGNVLRRIKHGWLEAWQVNRGHAPRLWVFSHEDGGYDVWRCTCGKEFKMPAA